MAVREKILTMDNLRKISICIAEGCSTCKNSGEIYGSLSSPLLMHKVYGPWCFVCLASHGGA